MPTYTSALLPNTNGLTLGSGALRWTAYLQDVDIAGTPTFTGRVAIKNLEDIRFADQFSGANVSAQIDAALVDISSLGLVVVPSSMGAGNATSIASGKAILDLRSGVPKFFTNNSISSAAWQLNNDGTVTSQGVKSVTANPASAGFIRAAKSDAIKFRNNANGGDVSVLSLSAGDLPALGAGPFLIPNASDTAVGKATIDTLTNKTLSGAALNGTGISNSVNLLNSQGNVGAITGTGADATMYTFTVPANTVAAGKGIRVKVTWFHNSGTATVSYKMKLGSTTLETIGPSNDSVTPSQAVYEIFNNSGVQNAQTWDRVGVLGQATVVSGVTNSTSAENFANSLALTFTFSVAATDQVTPKTFAVTLIQ